MAIKVVVGESSLTAGQMKDFWMKVSDGTIGRDNFGGFLEDPHKFTREQITIVRAIKILGAAKVVTAEQSTKVWNVAVPETLPAIRYTDEILRGCAESNKAGNTDFRLVYLQGFSLRQLRDIGEIRKIYHPSVSNRDWWLKEVEDAWATEKPNSDYYLIDFKGRWASKTWHKQDQKIADLDNYKRAHEASVAEAIVTIFKVTGERLLKGWFHWGSSQGSDASRIGIGCYEEDGVGVYRDDA